MTTPEPCVASDDVQVAVAPHRGSTLYALAIMSALCGVVSVCCLLPTFVGLPLGLTVWLVARRDLKLIRLGFMDPDGQRLTDKARLLSGMGLILTVYGFLGGLYFLWKALT